MPYFPNSSWTGARTLVAFCAIAIACGCTDRAAPSAPPDPPPEEEIPEQFANVAGEWIGAVLIDTPLPAGGRYQQMVTRRWFVLQDGANLQTNFGPGQLAGDSIFVASGTGEPHLRAYVDTLAGMASGQSYHVVTHPDDWPYGDLLLGPWHPTHMLQEGAPAPHADLSGIWSWSAGDDVTVQHDRVGGNIAIMGLVVGSAELPVYSAVTSRGLFQQSGHNFESGPPESTWLGGSIRGPELIQLLHCWQLSRFHAGCTASTLTR